MIELVSESRCIGCDICVRVCPTNVFEPVVDSAPVIARQEDCQTCYMCELYCPTNALFVAPEADHSVLVSEPRLSEQKLLGSYREAVGWSDERRESGARADQSYRLLPLATPARPPASTPSSAT
jgi:NAD-dependent dihydropyrimidine dehydrogenase PreA subunit